VSVQLHLNLKFNSEWWPVTGNGNIHAGWFGSGRKFVLLAMLYCAAQ